MVEESQRIKNNSNFLFFILSSSHNQMRDRLPLKAHCRGADWMNKTIWTNRIRQASAISPYTEIREGDNDLTPFILETK